MDEGGPGWSRVYEGGVHQARATGQRSSTRLLGMRTSDIFVYIVLSFVHVVLSFVFVLCVCVCVLWAMRVYV